MQSAKKRTEGRKVSSNKRVYGKVTIVGDQQQANLSIDIWKKAFKDASEKLCPIRACGHECGCLPVLARLVIKTGLFSYYWFSCCCSQFMLNEFY
jgi:hypothetical protein